MMPEYLLALPLRPTLSFLITSYWLAKLTFTLFLWEQHLFHNTFLYIISLHPYAHLSIPYENKFIKLFLVFLVFHVGYKVATGVSKPQTIRKPMIIKETDCKAKWLRSEHIGFNKLLY